MFADIAGFTAWSSTRDPAQVFTLLEQIYSSFDAIAKKRKVFKVETIGDCYVACCGLPEPRDDHAEVMLKFAMDCRKTMNAVVRKLEVVLGPDTCDLKMRIGLHSGAVTAGVLRGEKSRFQLFGDTVNTAARIESSGQADRIHLSQTTATLLIAAGKQDQIVKREELVQAKGKGELQTYWAKEKKSKRSSTGSSKESVGTSDREGMSGSDEGSDTMELDMRQMRLISWNVDILARQLRRILAMRENRTRKIGGELKYNVDPNTHVIDEIKEVIPLSNEAKSYIVNPDDVKIPSNVMEQLTDYVSNIATLYHDENRKYSILDRFFLESLSKAHGFLTKRCLFFLKCSIPLL
jgi:class 3 adenylate cyclase